jgi:hypothetical protein
LCSHDQVAVFIITLCRSHYITPEQFAQNVGRIIQKGKDSGVKHFLLISPPPVCEVCKQGKPVSLFDWGREGAGWRRVVAECAGQARHRVG